MDKRYQVFVSSTFQDLREERQQVTEALLELDCIPLGMELFPVPTDEQWELLKNLIRDCDYVLIIIGGRYGHVHTGQHSDTENTYRYAREVGKPVAVFMHKDISTLPADKCEQTEEGRQRIEVFRNLVTLRGFTDWDSPADLGDKVIRGILKLIKADPHAGWVRAAQALDENVLEEMLGLRRKIDELEDRCRQAAVREPENADIFAQGSDLFKADYTFVAAKGGDEKHVRERFETTWNEIFFYVSPVMIDEISEAAFKERLNRFMKDWGAPLLLKDERYKSAKLKEFQISDGDFHTIKIQLRALGLITKSDRARAASDHETYWTLTPAGDGLMTRLHAIKKENV